jgi:amidohydrolase
MLTAAENQTLIATRRDLHRHPELGYREVRTAGIVAERLRAAGFEVRTGVAETGVIGSLRGRAGPGPTLLLRADMDALPIQEECAHDFVSEVPGAMHACGHDAHVAIALAVAERLARDREHWAGEVRCLFQPAEEGGGGALRMVEEGALEGVDAALGLHVWLGLPSGTVGVVEGPLMAGSQEVRIEIRGRGGHGAIPEETVDATLVAAHVVVALQSVVSRNISPLESAVVSIGMMRAGSAHNVIAERALLEGTIRAFRDPVIREVRARIEQVASGLCAAFGATCRIDFGEGFYPPTVNDAAMAALVRRAAEAVVGPARVRTDGGIRTMAAEDFSEFVTRVPGCYFFLGGHNPGTGAVHPHHSPLFDLCEEALPVGVEVLERAARDYLQPHAG